MAALLLACGAMRLSVVTDRRWSSAAAMASAGVIATGSIWSLAGIRPAIVAAVVAAIATGWLAGPLRGAIAHVLVYLAAGLIVGLFYPSDGTSCMIDCPISGPVTAWGRAAQFGANAFLLTPAVVIAGLLKHYARVATSRSVRTAARQPAASRARDQTPPD